MDLKKFSVQNESISVEEPQHNNKSKFILSKIILLPLQNIHSQPLKIKSFLNDIFQRSGNYYSNSEWMKPIVFFVNVHCYYLNSQLHRVNYFISLYMPKHRFIFTQSSLYRKTKETEILGSNLSSFITIITTYLLI